MRPSRFHRRAVEFVVLRLSQRVLRTVNHLNDVHGGHAAEFVEQGGFRAGPQIVGKSLPKHVDAVAQIVQLPQCIRTRPRSAGIADVLVPLGNLVQIPGQAAAGREKVHLEDEMATARIILDHVLQRRIRYQATVPIVLSVYFHGGKARRQSAAREDVLRPYLDLRIVEIREIARPDVYGPDAEANFSGINAVEIDEPLQCGFQRARVVVAGWRVAEPPVGRLSRREEVRLAERQRMHCADLLSKVEWQTRAVDEIRNPYGPDRGRCDRAPEFTQFFNPHCRRIAGDKGGIDCADRDAGHPVRSVVRRGERLVNAGLIASERAPALQDECNLRTQ